jgi:hypothetical protein
MVGKILLMVMNTSVTIQMEGLKERDNIDGYMKVAFSRETLRMDRGQVKERGQVVMEISMLVIMKMMLSPVMGSFIGILETFTKGIF